MSVICEIGQNHMGDMDLACELIDLAKENGGGWAKFQLYDHKTLYHDHPEIPDVSLSYDQAASLFQYGRLKDIEVFFSVFDLDKVDWCERIGVKRYKLAKSMSRNKELINRLLEIGKPVFVSGELPYDRKYFNACYDAGVNPYPNFTRMYCVGKYPTPLNEIDFKTDLPGYSDHTIGIEAAKTMLRLGKIVEKHFAIEHDMGVDAEWSMTPSELRELKQV